MNIYAELNKTNVGDSLSGGYFCMSMPYEVCRGGHITNAVNVYCRSNKGSLCIFDTRTVSQSRALLLEKDIMSFRKR